MLKLFKIILGVGLGMLLCGCSTVVKDNTEKTTETEYIETNTQIEVSSDEESKQDEVIYTKPEVCWNTLLCEMVRNGEMQIGVSEEIEVYLKDIVEESDRYSYGTVLSRVEDRVCVVEIGIDDEKYGKYIAGEAGIYDMSQEYVKNLIAQAKEKHIFSIIGNITTTVSEELAALMGEYTKGDKYLKDLVTVCLQYMCDEYYAQNGEITGKLNCSLYLDEIEISPENRLIGAGYLCDGENAPVEISLSFALKNHVVECDEFEYRIRKGEIKEIKSVDEMLAIICDITTNDFSGGK